MRNGVVVTGVGVVAGSLTEVDRSAGYHLAESARMALLTRGLDLSAWIKPNEGRRMSHPSKMAVAAARMAIDNAGLGSEWGTAAPESRSVFVSSAFSAVEITEQLLRTVMSEGPEAVSPFLFAESVANAPAAQIAIATGARGRNLTIPQREAGVLTAVGRAAAEIAEGRADFALAGGVEEMSPLLHAMLDRFESLARDEVGRPFDSRRSGFLAAEGAVIVVLEEESRVRSRGGRILARIRDFAGAFDTTAPRIGWGRGEAQLAKAVQRMLNRASVSAQDIGRVVSGASGSIAGDRLEAKTLRALWRNDALPPVFAPKGAVGQYGGGFLASAIRAVTADEVEATAGFGEVDPDLQIKPYAGGKLPPASLTLVSSLASGGSASWLLLENPN